MMQMAPPQRPVRGTLRAPMFAPGVAASAPIQLSAQRVVQVAPESRFAQGAHGGSIRGMSMTPAGYPLTAFGGVGGGSLATGVAPTQSYNPTLLRSPQLAAMPQQPPARRPFIPGQTLASDANHQGCHRSQVVRPQTSHLQDRLDRSIAPSPTIGMVDVRMFKPGSFVSSPVASAQTPARSIAPGSFVSAPIASGQTPARSLCASRRNIPEAPRTVAAPPVSAARFDYGMSVPQSPARAPARSYAAPTPPRLPANSATGKSPVEAMSVSAPGIVPSSKVAAVPLRPLVAQTVLTSSPAANNAPSPISIECRPTSERPLCTRKTQAVERELDYFDTKPGPLKAIAADDVPAMQCVQQRQNEHHPPSTVPQIESLGLEQGSLEELVGIHEQKHSAVSVQQQHLDLAPVNSSSAWQPVASPQSWGSCARSDEPVPNGRNSNYIPAETTTGNADLAELCSDEILDGRQLAADRWAAVAEGCVVDWAHEESCHEQADIHPEFYSDVCPADGRHQHAEQVLLPQTFAEQQPQATHEAAYAPNSEQAYDGGCDGALCLSWMTGNDTHPMVTDEEVAYITDSLKTINESVMYYGLGQVALSQGLCTPGNVENVNPDIVVRQILEQMLQTNSRNGCDDIFVMPGPVLSTGYKKKVSLHVVYSNLRIDETHVDLKNPTMTVLWDWNVKLQCAAQDDA